jgi:hypothetical protein
MAMSMQVQQPISNTVEVDAARHRRHPESVRNPDSNEHEDQLVADGAMDRLKLETLVRDIENQPAWRGEADLNAAYYDNYQTSPEMRMRAQQTGAPLAVVNLISRTINSMLGQEAKTRTSWRVSADDEAHGDIADVVGQELIEAQRETYADMAISEAYASQCKAGLGWVEVSRNPDPWAEYPYRVTAIHRNEIWWDWRDKTSLALKQARWLVRTRWLDVDDAVAGMPQWKDIFERYGGGGWGSMEIASALNMTERETTAFNNHTQFRVNRDEWFDLGRKRIKFYEVWYRVKVRAIALVVRDAKTVEFDPKNKVHQMHLQTGTGKLVNAPKPVLRMALFAGPHRLMDVASNKTNFPYVPFWGFREDESKAPYSPVSGMRYPQDEYNARRSRLMWLLQTTQMFVDNDALDTEFNTIADLKNNIMRPGAVFVLKAERRNGEHSIDTRRDINLPKEQIEVMNDAKALIQDQPGLTAPMVGGTANGMSGVAQAGLLEQGMTAMGDLNDNYRFARQAVGELLTELIIADMGTKPREYTVGLGMNRRSVIVNGWDPAANLPMNPVAMTSIKTALSETPSTPAYKLAQQQQLMQVLQAAQALPEAIQVILPSYLETTDLPNRVADAKLLREKWGIPNPNDRAATDNAQQAAAQQKAAIAAQQQQLIAAQTEHEQGKTVLDKAQAELALSKAESLKAGVTKTAMDALEQHNNMQLTNAPGPAEKPTEEDLITKAMAEAGL